MLSRPRRENPPGVRRSQLIVTALVLLAVSLACSFSVPNLTNRARTPTPLSTQVSTPTSKPASNLGLIAFVGKDGNIYTTDWEGKQPVAITQDAAPSSSGGQAQRIYQFPTWAQDGQHLAYLRYTSSQSGPEGSLFTTLSNGKNQVQAFTSQEVLPFYMFWSPNSQTITFLGSDAAGVQSQYLIPAAGGESKLISTGAPYYWDWSPDTHSLILHIGGASSENPDARLTLVGLDGTIPNKELDLRPGFFQAPAWAPSGDVLALATQNDAGKEELVLAGLDGKVKQVLAQIDGPATIAWSPKGGQLAYTSETQTSSGPAIRLAVLDSAHPEGQKQVALGDLVAFFWSPDGQKIAYLAPASGSSGVTDRPVARSRQSAALAVQVYDLASGNTKQVAAFTPTDSFQQILPFYSQYQRSITIWSPDSQNLVLSGVDADGANAISVVSADGSQNHRIADGDLAIWSWK